jgi:signal transduction histidine kinase
VDRATGPSAISWWSWLVTLPFAVTVMSGLQYISGGPWAVAAVGGLEHAAVGATMLAGWAVLRATPQRVRVPVVFLVFAVIGLLRPLLFLASGWVLGIPVAAGDLVGRIFINVVTTITMLSLIAAAVDLVRDHIGVYRRLRAAQRASARDAERTVARIAELRRSVVETVLAQLDDAANVAAAHGIRPADAARLLRGLAQEVVRPASHRLYSDVVATPDEGAADGPVRVRDWVASVLLRMRAAPALPLALLFAVLVTPFGIAQYGLLFCLPPLACGFAVIWAGNLAAEWVVERAPRVLRAAVLLVAYAAIGVLLSLTTEFVVSVLGGDPDMVWVETITYPAIAFVAALVASLSARVRRDQTALEAAVQANVLEAADGRGALDREREGLARLLHSGVQSELIAAALSLGAGSGEDASDGVREVVSNIRAELSVPRSEPDAADRIGALVESWGSAIPLRSSFGDGVWERLGEPGRAEAVVEAISEGLANAVRHGDGSEVTLEVLPAAGGGVSVVVVSGGALSPGVPGIGLRQLAERGDVALREVDGRVELAVTIP